MNFIYKNAENLILIGEDWVNRLAQEAPQSPRQISRLLAHTSPDQKVQEMLIAFTDKCWIKPNRSIGRSETLIVLRGEVRVIFFDEGGRAERHIDFAPLGGGKPAYYRLSSAPWHTMTALSPVAVVHEILEGPFMASQDPPPPWMPQSEEALREFVQKAGQPQAA